VLIAPLGAAGPVFGSVMAVTFCQVLPNLWYVRRDMARRSAAAASAAAAAAVARAAHSDPA
jgi:hypothetical protein